MKSKSDPRHNARKLALTSIFCWLFYEPDEKLCLNLSQNLLKSKNVDLELTQSIINGVKIHRKQIDDLIRKNAPEWPIDKIAKIDLVVLRIAIYETLFCEDVPEKVALVLAAAGGVGSAAVELAKEFGNDTSSKFVNGVLGSIVK